MYEESDRTLTTRLIPRRYPFDRGRRQGEPLKFPLPPAMPAHGRPHDVEIRSVIFPIARGSYARPMMFEDLPPLEHL